MGKTIRAAVCREFNEPLSIESLALAPPGPGQVEVRVAASAICHSDIHYIEGAWGGELPAVWGHEAAGIVEALGPGVADIEIGDLAVITLVRSCGQCRFCQAGASVSCARPPTHASPLSDADGNQVGHGYGTAAFAERVVVDRSQLVTVGGAIDTVAASLLACGVITGVGAARNTASVQAGSTVVVIGAGGVGLNAIQGARIAGASTIVAVDINDSKLEAATRFGATHTIGATPDLASAVALTTEGSMADYVLVTVGAGGPIEQASTLLAPNGTAVIVGMPATGVMSSFDPGTLAALNQSILGSKMGTSTIAVDIPDLVARYRAGDLLLDELVTATYGLDEINEAIDAVRRGDALRNVIVFPDPAATDPVADPPVEAS